MLKEALKGILTPEENDELIAAFDQIGSIIIVRIPDSLLPKKRIIGKALLDRVKIARSVFYQASPVSGDHRTRNLEIIAGCDDTKTEYKESGCRFLVDVQNAFFSPRLSTERGRIAGLVCDGETMVNMFAGVGMFSIMAAKQKKCTVYSIDINKTANSLCEHNISINRLAGKVIPMHGDAADIVRKRLVSKSDRTLMLLPERSDEFLNDAVTTTRDGGIIHYYSHIHADKKTDAGRLSEEHYLDVAPVRSEILGSRLVRAVGPRYYQTVVDVKISK
ncbi:MAG: class I SAM-dependent methyltransferase family protein [Nitrosopumilus sp. B06]|nr:MAG: class I SAM-dependent methyltransferase family protein [Nitrosopumilus sp. B06]